MAGRGGLSPHPGVALTSPGAAADLALPSGPGDPSPEHALGARGPSLNSYPILQGNAVYSGLTNGETETQERALPKATD